MRPSGAVPDIGGNHAVTLGRVASGKSGSVKSSLKCPDSKPLLPPLIQPESPTEPLEPTVAVTPCTPPAGVCTVPWIFPLPTTTEFALVVTHTTSPLVPAVAGLYGPRVLSKLSVPTLYPLAL